MNEIQIIDIDLGQTIDEIISEATSKPIDIKLEPPDPKILAKIHKDTKLSAIDNKLEHVYNQLVQASNDGRAMLLDEMVRATQPEIDNPTSLILRLKSFIKKTKGNKMVLHSTTINKKRAYKLIPFNN